MKILADASLPHLYEAFPEPFEIILYHHPEEINDLIAGVDVLLCRSTLQVTKQLVKDSQLRFVATASSGTDHLHSLELAQLNIQCLDAKGSNAKSVADYVLSCYAYLINQYAFTTSKVGIIGIGKVGTYVAQYFQALGLELKLFDPLKAALDSDFKSCHMDELLSCNLICVHANLHNIAPYSSRNLLSYQELSQLNANTAIINAARGGIINEDDLVDIKKPLFYCTDVFLNEPHISSSIIDFATLCTPHIAGHSIEAKFNAVSLLSEKLHALYQLNSPFNYKSAREEKELSAYFLQKNWPATILTLYNPVNESLLLKNADDKLSAFLTLRKQHVFRHDFKLN